jgi:hypothetical protein
LRLVARFRTPEGRIVRIQQAEVPAPIGSESRSRRMTPPPDFLLPAAAAAEDPEVERDPWWILRALAHEAYQKHF